MLTQLVMIVLVFGLYTPAAHGYLSSGLRGHYKVSLHALRGKKEGEKEVYSNPVAQALSAFIRVPVPESGSIVEENDSSTRVDLDSIDWNRRKRKKTSMKRLSGDLTKALKQREWFVTGDVEPSFFSEDFYFQDPDVATTGIENYARGVARIFSPGTRAEVLKTDFDEGSRILTITWRLEGRVSIGPRGLPIKAFLVYSDLTVDENGLICFQKDRFSLPGWDIFLSALFPFTIGRVTAAPLPSASELSI